MVIKMEEMKMIKVSEGTWKELMHMKIDKGFSSIDEVIKHLLQSQEVH